MQSPNAPRAGAGGHAVPARTAAATTSAATNAAATRDTRSYAAAAAGARTNASGSGGALSTKQPGPQKQDIQMSPAERFAEDEVEDQADEGETVPEDADDQRGSRSINYHILRLENTLERRRKALGKAELAVAAQTEEIAKQQAVLVELQASEDNLREEIRAVTAERSELSQRLARLNANRDIEQQPAAAVQQTPLQNAMDCLNRSFLGLQHFQDQSPEIKEILVQFARGIEQMQAQERSAVVPGQTTLHQSFAAQRATQDLPVEQKDLEYGPHLAAAIQRKREAVPNIQLQPQAPVAPTRGERIQSGPTIPAQHTIHSGTTTPMDPGGQQTETIPIAGNKSYGRAARATDPTCVTVELAVPVDVPMDSTETALAVWRPPRTRAQLLAQLEADVQSQADRVRKRAADASSLRASPY